MGVRVNTPEFIEALTDITDKLDEMMHETSILDEGQAVMLAQASTRTAQVVKELQEFLVPEDIDECLHEEEDTYNPLYEEWHDHGE